MIILLIKTVKVQSQIVVKIYEKHSVLAAEIEKVLQEDEPIFKKVGGDQYIALGIWDRYLTIFFAYDGKIKEAVITTAYPSSRKQIKSYKRLME